MLKSLAVSVLPSPVIRALKPSWHAVRYLSGAIMERVRPTPEQLWVRAVVAHTKELARGIGPIDRECPACNYVGLFRPFGWPVVPENLCPQCESVSRHRLFVLWVRAGDKISGRDVLHFAPEKKLGQILRQKAATYLSADNNPVLTNTIQAASDRNLDIERIDLPDRSFDIIVCLHLLEHVDDRAALAEMYRVLRPCGLCLIMVPVIEGWETYENPAIKSNRDRWQHFGQNDHVRYYGSDIRDRIKAAGFDLTEFMAVGEDVVRYSLNRGERLFIARRPN